MGRAQPTKLSFTHWSLWVAHIPQTLIHYIILNYFKRYLLAATPASVRSFLSFLSQPVLITHQQQLKHTISYSKRQSAWMETTSRKKIIVLISPHDTSLHHSHRSYLFWCTHPIKLFHFSDSLRFTFVLFFITLNSSRNSLLVVTFALSFVFTESFYTKHIQKVSCPIFPFLSSFPIWLLTHDKLLFLFIIAVCQVLLILSFYNWWNDNEWYASYFIMLSYICNVFFYFSDTISTVFEGKLLHMKIIYSSARILVVHIIHVRILCTNNCLLNAVLFVQVSHIRHHSEHSDSIFLIPLLADILSLW